MRKYIQKSYTFITMSVTIQHSPLSKSINKDALTNSRDRIWHPDLVVRGVVEGDGVYEVGKFVESVEMVESM